MNKVNLTDKEKAKLRPDLFGQIPSIQDIIVFVPTGKKQLVYGVCVGFTSSSKLPIILLDKKFRDNYYGQNTPFEDSDNCYTPKKGFVVRNSK